MRKPAIAVLIAVAFMAAILAITLAVSSTSHSNNTANDSSTGTVGNMQTSEPEVPAHSASYDAGYQNNLGLSPATKSGFPSASDYCQAMQEGMHSELMGSDATDYVAGCIEAFNSGK